MTTGGRRPQLVRWTWQRDVTHRFRSREQVMGFFADGLVALCVRTQQNDESMLDRWYGLFLLSTELHDERLMRLRLERLLCWRESPERRSSYQRMLPVLILAGVPRQCEHWQRTVEASTLKSRLDPLAGALACLPPQESGRVNPWLLNWRTLSTDHPCHLQELLGSVPPAVFLPSLGIVESEDEKLGSRSHANASGITACCAGTTIRLRRLVVGNLAKRASRITRDGLHQLGCLESMVTEVGKRWHLCERGLRLIAAANHIHIRNIAVVSDETADGETPTVAQRGEAWLLERVLHTAGIYGFFARLMQSARRETRSAGGRRELSASGATR